MGHGENCGLYKRPMVCEECGDEVAHLGTRHSDWKHICWPCLGKSGVHQRLHELNEKRKQQAESH